jgi:hypothetical protein
VKPLIHASDLGAKISEEPSADKILRDFIGPDDVNEFA